MLIRASPVVYGEVWASNSSAWKYSLLHSLHTFISETFASFHLPSLNKSSCLSGWRSVEACRTRRKARNRKHPPWVLLQRDEQQQKQPLVVCWETKRTFDHLGAHHFLFLPLKHDYHKMSLSTLYVATSTQVTFSSLCSTWFQNVTFLHTMETLRGF